MKPHKATRKGFTLIELLVVITIIGVLASLGLAAYGPIKEQVKKVKSKDNLRSLYMLIQLYTSQWNAYPTTQSPQTRYDKGGGVRDLYPLYETGLLGEDQLKLLQPQGAALIPFSSEPKIDEFDKYHIGYSYNSTAIPDDAENPPILADQGVSSGVLHYKTKDRGTKPVNRGGALVLFSSGTIELITANKKGKLSTKKVGADEWGRLGD